MSKLQDLFREIEQKQSEINALRPIDPERMARVMQKFRLDWNFHSNHIEGNSLTYGETKSFLLHGITADGKPFRDHLDIKGHNEAILLLEDILKQSRPLTETFIRELHKIILKEPYPSKAITPDGQPTTRMIQVGVYKSVPNHVKTVTGEMFYFATPEETPAKMGDLVAWYSEKVADETYSRVQLAALFHYRFICIHPFDDGNGRVGRILMNLILMQAGYPPVVIKTQEKEAYYRAIRQADGGDLNKFVEYVIGELLHSQDLMIRGAKGESIEDDDDLDKEIKLWEKGLVKVEDEVIEGTDDVQWNLLESNWIPFGVLLYGQISRFDSMFHATNHQLYFQNVMIAHLDPSLTNPALDFLRKRMLNRGMDEGRIRLSFRDFLKGGANVFGIEKGISFKLEKLRYVVKYEKHEYHFLYSQPIPESTMQEIAKMVARDIFDEIKQKTEST
jgi:Fic family protein